MSRTRSLVVAEFGAPHGIKGEVRLKSFTAEPLAVARYGPLAADDGRTFELASVRPAAGTSPDMLVVRISGVADRNAAEALKGIRLSIPFDKLPPPGEDEFYHADLIGLRAVTPEGTELGTIVAVPNFGAGDLVEVAPPQGQSILIPFSRAAVPSVDIAGGTVTVILPAVSGDDAGAEGAS